MNTLKIIENELIEVGVSPNLSGFYYLLHAVNYYLENNKEFYEVSITKDLYPYVAFKIGGKVTSSCVERSIRHSVEKVYNRLHDKHLDYISNIDSGKPTNSSFISYLLIRVKNKINEESN